METGKKMLSRKTFVRWSAGLLGLFAVAGVWFGQKRKKKSTVKMLTQDGRLVEIDAALLEKKGRKITDAELQSWVKK